MLKKSLVLVATGVGGICRVTCLLSSQVSLGLLHILNRVLGPLIDGMLAFTALGGEMWEPLLEGQPKDLDVDVVAELFGHDEEEVAEDNRGEEINDIRTSREQGHTRLVDECEKGDG